jgi:hypothetical protein
MAGYFTGGIVLLKGDGYRFKNNNPPIFIDPIQQYNNLLSIIPYPPVTLHKVESSIIKQEDIDQFAIHIERRIEGIKKEIEKTQEMQLQQIAKIYNLYDGLTDNLNQKMMEMDERLYLRQTQQHDAAIKNLIAVLDGV